MATFRNDTGDDLTLDRFGLYVPAGSTFEIPDADADSLAGHVALVRLASDVTPDIVIPAEIARDLEQPLVDEQPAGELDDEPAAEQPADEDPAAEQPHDDEQPAPEQPVEAPEGDHVDEQPVPGLDDVDIDSFGQA